MKQQNKRAWVVVAALAILALALAAVGPVKAQTGGTGQPGTRETGIRVPLSEDETLGSLVAFYHLDSDFSAQLDDFLSANMGLRLSRGQAITYPEGVSLAADAQKQTDSLTYQTQFGDTLGEALVRMGFVPTPDDASDLPAASGVFDSGAGGESNTGSENAGEAADPANNEGSGTGSDEADEVEQAAGSGDAAGQQATPAPESPTEQPSDDDAQVNGSGLTSDQLQEFVALNSALTFEPNQVLTLLPGIPSTGVELQATAAVGANSAMPGSAQNVDGAEVGSWLAGQIPTPSLLGDDASVLERQQSGADQPDNAEDSEGDAATGEEGESGASGRVTAGQLPTPGAFETLVPGSGNNGQDTDTSNSGPFTVANNETLGTVLDHFAVNETNAAAFVAANCDLVLVEGQDLTFEDQAAASNPVTAAGGTLCGALELGGFDRSGFADGVDDRSSMVEEDARLWRFLNANRALQFENGGEVSGPPRVSIPQTGSAAGNPQPVVQTAPPAGQNARQPGLTDSSIPQVPRVCEGIPEAPQGFGFYRYRGETLRVLAQQLNTTISRLFELNPNGIEVGKIMVLPGAEAPGLWNNLSLDGC